MLDVIAQATEATNPILPSSNGTFWAAVWIITPLLVMIAFLALVGRYFRRLRLAAEEAATRAGAAEREVAALRAELREASA